MSLYDAETGKKLFITEAIWTKDDGRINDDARSMILMGTGRLLIDNSSTNTNSADKNTTTKSYINPLIEAVEKNGPLNPLFNLNIHPRRNSKLKSSKPTLSDSIDKANIKISRISSNTSSLSSNINEYSKRLSKINSEQILRKFPSCSRIPNIALASFTPLSPHKLNGTVDEDINWDRLESNYLKELNDLSNKLSSFYPPVDNILNHCQDIAHLKRMHMQKLHMAIALEREDDERRKKALNSCAVAARVIRLSKSHVVEREIARENLRRMQHDHEVILMQKMKLAKLLW